MYVHIPSWCIETHPFTSLFTKPFDTLVSHFLRTDTHHFSLHVLPIHALGPNPFDHEHGLDHHHLHHHQSTDINDDMYQHAALSLLRKVPTSTSTSTSTAAGTGTGTGAETTTRSGNDDDYVGHDMTTSSFSTSWHKRPRSATIAEGGGGGTGGGTIGIVKHVSFRQVIN